MISDQNGNEKREFQASRQLFNIGFDIYYERISSYVYRFLTPITQRA